MSWILGSIGAIDDASVVRIHQEAPAHSLAEFRTPGAYFITGGIRETCNFGYLDNGDKGAGFWIVNGLGIGVVNGQKRILRQEDWQRSIRSGATQIQNSIEGQYCGVIVKSDVAEWFTDPIGSRDLFWTALEGKCFVSTRIDWLSRMRGGAALNEQAFSARWLFFYQLSYDSILQGIERLGPGGRAIVDKDTAVASNRAWQFVHDEPTDLESSLRDLLEAPGPDSSLTLGLSGGLDSRLLFALLPKDAEVKWDVHTFGDSRHPDSIVARKIAHDFHIMHSQLDEGQSPIHKSIDMMKEFASQGMTLRPASAFIQLQHYPSLVAQNRIVIDGSFGEVGRRQMLNRIVLRAKADLEAGAFDKLYPHLLRRRADVFSMDVTVRLQQLARDQVMTVSERMPDPRKIGVGNWVDLFVVRHGIPNVNAAEQARIDHIVPSYMPFVQSSSLSAALSVPLADRKNGRLFRRIIRKHEPRLASYPLVGVDGTYPFILPPVPAFVYRKFNVKLGRGIKNTRHCLFLHHVKEYVQDTLLSADTLECSYYDPNKVRAIVNGYYAGNESLGTELDWLLAFDTWRRRVKLIGS
jgi:hypothetical protein